MRCKCYINFAESEKRPMRETYGIILAGGQARRLGCVDKALIEVGGEPILARLAHRLSSQCAGLALNANGDPARFAGFDLAVVADDIAGFPGPLAGVLAGMDYVAANFADISDIVTVPADTPFIPRDLVARLWKARERAGADIAVARSGERDHYAIALWPVALRGALRRVLAEEELRKVAGFIGRFTATVVEWPTAPYDPFFNVNRPEDVERAEEMAAHT